MAQFALQIAVQAAGSYIGTSIATSFGASAATAGFFGAVGASIGAGGPKVCPPAGTRLTGPEGGERIARAEQPLTRVA